MENTMIIDLNRYGTSCMDAMRISRHAVNTLNPAKILHHIDRYSSSGKLTTGSQMHLELNGPSLAIYTRGFNIVAINVSNFK